MKISSKFSYQFFSLLNIGTLVLLYLFVDDDGEVFSLLLSPLAGFALYFIYFSGRNSTFESPENRKVGLIRSVNVLTIVALIVFAIFVLAGLTMPGAGLAALAFVGYALFGFPAIILIWFLIRALIDPSNLKFIQSAFKIFRVIAVIFFIYVIALIAIGHRVETERQQIFDANVFLRTADLGSSFSELEGFIGPDTNFHEPFYKLSIGSYEIGIVDKDKESRIFNKHLNKYKTNNTGRTEIVGKSHLSSILMFDALLKCGNDVKLVIFDEKHPRIETQYSLIYLDNELIQKSFYNETEYSEDIFSLEDEVIYICGQFYPKSLFVGSYDLDNNIYVRVRDWWGWFEITHLKASEEILNWAENNPRINEEWEKRLNN